MRRRARSAGPPAALAGLVALVFLAVCVGGAVHAAIAADDHGCGPQLCDGLSGCPATAKPLPLLPAAPLPDEVEAAVAGSAVAAPEPDAPSRAPTARVEAASPRAPPRSA